MTSATACDDSSAGIIPSNRANRVNAASAWSSTGWGSFGAWSAPGAWIMKPGRAIFDHVQHALALDLRDGARTRRHYLLADAGPLEPMTVGGIKHAWLTAIFGGITAEAGMGKSRLVHEMIRRHRDDAIVLRNIDKHGGDPARVVVGGHSAGGRSMHGVEDVGAQAHGRSPSGLSTAVYTVSGAAAIMPAWSPPPPAPSSKR